MSSSEPAHRFEYTPTGQAIYESLIDLITKELEESCAMNPLQAIYEAHGFLLGEDEELIHSFCHDKFEPQVLYELLCSFTGRLNDFFSNKAGGQGRPHTYRVLKLV